MENTYQSVTQFFLDLKAALLSSGLTIEREVGDFDTIFDAGTVLFRLQKKEVSPSVVAVGWAFGTDAAVLSQQVIDTSEHLPFALQDGAAFTPGFFWFAPKRRLEFYVAAVGFKQPGCIYRVSCCLDTQETFVTREDRSQTGPNIFAGM